MDMYNTNPLWIPILDSNGQVLSMYNPVPAHRRILDRLTPEFLPCNVHSMFQFTLPTTILSAKVPWQCDRSRLLDILDLMLASVIFPPTNVWFRPVSWDALELTMIYARPARMVNTYTDSFGPGMYATDNLEYAIEMSAPGTALMIFHNINEAYASVMDLPPAEWIRVVKNFLNSPPGLPNFSTMSDNFLNSDIVRGPVHTRNSLPGPTHGQLQPTSMTQICARTPRGTAVMSSALVAIVFFA